MNVNKKLNRMRQWGKEKMGAEVKSGTSEDFKTLEVEMAMRQEGLEKMHNSMSTYVKTLNKRSEGEAKEKVTAIAYLGSSMTRHGEEFENDSQFGQCLVKFGMANERISRMQDSFASQATSTWLEALERSLVQMKDYQASRRRLESRRLAYDTSQAKIQRAKKEDYRAEEELRSQKAKFEESTEDVQRRMQDVVDSEEANLIDLHAFLEAELAYHERCRDILLHLKKDWPLDTSSPNPSSHHDPQPRKASARSFVSQDESDPLPLPNPPFHSNSSRTSSANSSPSRDRLPSLTRSTTSESHPSRAATPLSMVATQPHLKLKPPHTRGRTARSGGQGIFGDEHNDDDEDDGNTSSSTTDHHTFWETPRSTRSISPATTASTGTGQSFRPGISSRQESWQSNDSHRSNDLPSQSGVPALTQLSSISGTVKKAPPPPPPPSRATKPRPPPPPPPMKRNINYTSTVSDDA